MPEKKPKPETPPSPPGRKEIQEGVVSYEKPPKNPIPPSQRGPAKK